MDEVSEAEEEIAWNFMPIALESLGKDDVKTYTARGGRSLADTRVR